MYYRQAFHFLPVLSSSDIAHGSWWFVFGSLFFSFTAAVPLIDIYYKFFSVPDNTSLDVFSASSTWVCLIVSGLFYTVGSYLFVRAFEEPPLPAVMGGCLGNDELLAAWLFFLAALPSIPFSFFYLRSDPNEKVYWGLSIAALLFVSISAMFVYSTYPKPGNAAENTEQSRRVLTFLSCCCCCCKKDGLFARHLANDWLASSWFFFWNSLLMTLGSLVYLFGARNDRQVFVWSASLIDSAMFAIGSAYFCAGSYSPPKEDEDVNFDEISIELPGIGDHNDSQGPSFNPVLRRSAESGESPEKLRPGATSESPIPPKELSSAAEDLDGLDANIEPAKKLSKNKRAYMRTSQVVEEAEQV